MIIVILIVININDKPRVCISPCFGTTEAYMFKIYTKGSLSAWPGRRSELGPGTRHQGKLILAIQFL